MCLKKNALGHGPCFICGKTEHRTSSCPLKEQKEERALIYRPEPPDVDELYKNYVEAGNLVNEFFSAEVYASRKGNAITIKPLLTFAGTIPTVLMNNIEKQHYKTLMPVQRYAYPIISAGSDLMACAQTGTGKTAAFLLPILSQMIKDEFLTMGSKCAPRCLIVSPTRELAIQIYNEARKFANGTRCEVAVLYGGTSVNYQLSNLSKVSKRNVMLIATPGRLINVVREGNISLMKLKHVVLDEADRLLDMGFCEVIDELFRHPDMPGKKDERQTLMFSATFPFEVQKLAQKHLREDYVMLAIDALGSANRCIRQEFIEVRTQHDKKKALLKLLDIDIKSYEVEDDDVFKRKTLVFVKEKYFADVLGAAICQAGVKCITIHGDRYQDQREAALKSFREGEFPVLIATAVAARGLDIRGVDHVINYDLPETRQEYIHRIGRTGRIGNPGRATSFYVPEKNRELAEDLVAVIQQVHQEPPDFLLRDIRFASSSIASSVRGWSTLRSGDSKSQAEKGIDETDMKGKSSSDLKQEVKGTDETDTKLKETVKTAVKSDAEESPLNEDW